MRIVSDFQSLSAAFVAVVWGIALYASDDPRLAIFSVICVTLLVALFFGDDADEVSENIGMAMVVILAASAGALLSFLIPLSAVFLCGALIQAVALGVLSVPDAESAAHSLMVRAVTRNILWVAALYSAMALPTFGDSFRAPAVVPWMIAIILPFLFHGLNERQPG